jgi:hypothetical protein
MIEYVEARNADFEVIGILDTAQSIIWHSVYYGVGDFQIYIRLTDALQIIADARYITRTNNDEVGVIESILIADDIENGKMITIKGRFAKSLLGRRIIYTLSGTSNKATILRGNVETAVRSLVNDNAIASRSLGVLELGAVAGISKTIVDESGAAAQKQVSFEDLLAYTEAVLKEYSIASTVKLNGRKLQYIVYEGADRSADNSDGNQPIVFSKEFDNLISSEYMHDNTLEKNVALIGGEGEGIDRFCVLLGSQSGLQRKEVFVDASSVSRKYKDENDVEKEYTDAEYTAMLKTHGKQETSDLTVIEDFNGAIDITNGNWRYGIDVFLGDIVTVQDNDIGVFKNARLAEVTEYQDQDGYTIEAVYQGE